MEGEKRLKVVYSEEATNDLDQIFTFIERNFSDRIAEKSIKDVVSRIKDLATQPYAGKAISLRHRPGFQFRQIVKGNSIIIYTIMNEVVYILRVYDERQLPPFR